MAGMQSVINFDPSRAEQILGFALAAYTADAILPQPDPNDPLWETLVGTIQRPPAPQGWFEEIMNSGPMREVTGVVGIVLPAAICWAFLSPETKKKTAAFLKRHYNRLVSWDSAVGLVSTLLPQLALVTVGGCLSLCWTGDTAALKGLGEAFSCWTVSTIVYHCIYWHPDATTAMAPKDDCSKNATRRRTMPSSALALGLRAVGRHDAGCHGRFGMFFDISAGRPFFNALASCLFGGMEASFLGYFAGSYIAADAAMRLEPAIHGYLGTLSSRAGDP
ncbi:hypothetical protein RB597_000124 [Gaeumannomyces tritici]